MTTCPGTTPWKETSERLKLHGTVRPALIHPVAPLLTRNPVFMCWRTSRMGIFFTQNGLWAMEKCRLVPKGTHAIGNDLATAAEALIAGGQTKLFTPMALWVCTKVRDDMLGK